MDQFTAMKVFVRIVEAGNFTRAAETLSMPRATVSTFVQGLESHLKTKLLHRTSRQVKVTTDGAFYYERALGILAEIDALNDNLLKSQGQPAGRLRVEIAGAIADSVLIPALQGFQSLYPGIQIDIGVNDRSVDYLAENVDCAIRAGTPSEASLVARLVGEVRFLNCASPEYFRKHGVPGSVEDIKTGGHRFIGYLHPESGQLARFQFARNGDSIDFLPEIGISTSDTRSSMVAALHGMGIFQAPEVMVAPAIEDGRLLAVMTDWSRTPLPIYIVYPPNRHLSHKVRVFVDWLVKLLAQRATTSA